MKTRISRRALGLAICLAPVTLAIASLALASTSPASFRSHRVVSGMVLAGIALAIALLNVWCSVGRYALHRLLGRSRETYRHASGIPFVGNLFAVAAILWGFGNAPTAVLGLIVFAIDTGGCPWFVVATWRDDGFWGPPVGQRNGVGSRLREP